MLPEEDFGITSSHATSLKLGKRQNERERERKNKRRKRTKEYMISLTLESANKRKNESMFASRIYLEIKRWFESVF